MDDQIMKSSIYTATNETTCFSEIDVSNHTLMAEWIKGKLLELDSILEEGMSNKNSA